MPKSIFSLIFKVLFVCGLLWIGYQVLDIILLVFLAFIISSALSPIVEYFHQKHVPKSISIITMLGIVFVATGFFFYYTIPILVEQVRNLVEIFPIATQDLIRLFKLQDSIGAERIVQLQQEISNFLSQQLTANTSYIFSFGARILDWLLSMVTVLFLTFYFIMDKQEIEDFILTFISSTDRMEARIILSRTESKLGAWLRGQITLMVIIGVFTYIGLTILGINYAFPLAIIAGLLEIVPIVGPTVSAIPAILIALSDSPIKAISVIALYILIQQFEANLIVPKVMGQAVGLHPIAVILAIMIGSKLGGPLGAIISVPITVVLMVGYNVWKERENQKDVQESPVITEP